MIFFVMLIAYGVNIFNDGIYSDGWLLYHNIKNADFSNLHRIFTDIGHPGFAAYYYWGLASTGNFILACRVMTFCIIVGSGLAIYCMLRQMKVFSEQDCVLCAIFASTYSAYQMQLEPIMSWSSLCLMCFYVGFVLYQKTLMMHKGIGRAALWFVAAVLLLFSFDLNSLLVYYYGVLIAVHHFADYRRENASRVWRLVRLAVMCALPVLYWLIKSAYYPKASFYADYNELIFSPFVWFWSVLKYLFYAVNAQLALSIANIITYPLLLFVVFVLTKALLNIDDASPRPNDKKRSKIIIVSIGALMFMASIGAYVLVGKSPLVNGWESRLSILISLPVAIVGIGLVRMIFSSVIQDAIAKRIILFGVMALIVGFVMTDWKNSFSWQLNWIRDRALMMDLQSQPEWSNYRVYIIKDESGIPRAVYYHLGAYAGILSDVWGGETRIGLDASLYDSVSGMEEALKVFRAPQSWSIMRNVDPSGDQIALVIKRNTEMRNARIYALYYYYKYFDPAQMHSFLSDIFKVERIQIDEVFKKV